MRPCGFWSFAAKAPSMSVGMRTSANTTVMESFRAADSLAPRLCAGTADLTENTDAVELRDGVVQRFQLLCDELRARSQARARNVPARPREAGTALLGLPEVTITSGLSPTRLAASSAS